MFEKTEREEIHEITETEINIPKPLVTISLQRD